MATKRVQFFMTPAEFASFVAEILSPLGLEFVDSSMKAWPPSESLMPRRPAFLAPSGVHRPSPEDINPARDGWLVVAPPAVDGNKLYLAEIAGKSDWANALTKTTTSNSDVQRLYGRVAARLKPLLSFPVAATNEITGKRGTYKSIGYTEGARRWLEKAGEWRQEGVGNIRFGIE